MGVGGEAETETCSWDPSTSAVLTYYAAVVYDPCMMSVLLGDNRGIDWGEGDRCRGKERQTKTKEEENKSNSRKQWLQTDDETEE